MGKAKAALIVVAAVLIIPIALAAVTTIVNDNTAADLEKRLSEIPLPDGMTCAESFSAAGKIIGNGNGMQYLAVMLITGDVPLESLQNYYAQYNCGVIIQETSEIDSYHGDFCFDKFNPQTANYRVEMWGKAPSWFFAEFDLRGH